jgi:hypothetical protein
MEVAEGEGWMRRGGTCCGRSVKQRDRSAIREAGKQIDVIGAVLSPRMPVI